jgi:acyl-CoA synthetase (AMP-forming)/AMP-acid ligase II
MATDPLAQHAANQPDKPAVIVDASGGGRASTTSFAALNGTVNRLVHALEGMGVAPGSRVVWCGPNSLEVVVVIHAARKAKVTAVPLSYRFVADEMQYVIDNSDAVCVLVDAEQAPLVAAVRHELPNVTHVVVYGGPVPEGSGFLAWDDVLAGSTDDEPTDAVDITAGSAMIYTSGTTGKPKGALRTKSDAMTVLAMLQKIRLGAPDDVSLTTGPLYHSGPLAWMMLAHTLGQTAVVVRKFDPVRWLELVREHRVTNTFSAPTQMKRVMALPEDVLAAADLSSMRSLVVNAAPVPYALKEEIIGRFGDSFLYEVYGSTELGVATVLEPQDQLRKPGSCGRVYGTVEVKVVREDGTEAPVGEPGELFIRSGLAMDGYHRTDEKLAEHVAADAAPEDQGWFSVGDVAYLDDEGFVYICDRRKDMIISGGVNIYPAEIEAVLHAYPDLLDCGVFGIPDDEWGEAVHAVVQPKGDSLDLDELRAFVDARLAAYKRPRTYELRPELPRTESGKLLKRQLRDEHWKDRGSRV